MKWLLHSVEICSFYLAFVGALDATLSSLQKKYYISSLVVFTVSYTMVATLSSLQKNSSFWKSHTQLRGVWSSQAFVF